MEIDYDNMVAYGCFAFAMSFIIFLTGYDLYPRNKWLGAIVLVFISLMIYFTMNNISSKYKKEINSITQKRGKK